MKKYLLFIICFTSLIGCKKEEDNLTKFQNGVYVGTFQREFVWAATDTAKITMTFSSGTWSGSSNKVKYPALCNGTYSIVGDTIIFENECAWSAEFDWSLILSGKYLLKTQGDSIEFYRDYHSESSDTYIDIYKMIRQEQ